jgi:hypothetical protein
VQGFYLKTEVVENLRRNRPLNSWKGKCREASVESLREASQVGERVCRETLLSFANHQRKNDQTRSLGRLHEVPWAVRFIGVALGLSPSE